MTPISLRCSGFCDASAVKGRLTVEDIIHGGVYEVADVHAASQYDGAHGGWIVNRIAHVRGVWRSCSIPIYEARRPDDPQIGDSLARSFRETGYKPDFAGLVRFFYGGPKTPVSTGKMWKPRAKPYFDALIKKASNR